MEFNEPPLKLYAVDDTVRMQNSVTTLQPDPALQNSAPALAARQTFLDKYRLPLQLKDLQEIEFVPASVVTRLAMEWR